MTSDLANAQASIYAQGPSLKHLTCAKCEGVMDEVKCMERNIRVGWLCVNVKCLHFEKAILREKRLGVL
jgi:hypothetical protein